MATAAQIAANTKTAESLARSQTGLSGVASNDFTYDQRVAYNKALAAIIQKYPERFAPDQVQTAGIVAAKVYPPLDPGMSLKDQTAMFVSEMAKEGVKINNALNPFSSSNLSTTKWLMILAGVGVAAYIFWPMITNARQSAKSVKFSRG